MTRKSTPQMRRKPRSGSFSLRVLYALAKGSVEIGAILLAPGLRPSPSKEVRRWSYEIVDRATRFEYEDFLHAVEDARARRRLANAMYQLRKRRFVQIQKKENRYILKITQSGQGYIKKIEVERLSIKPQLAWDGYWRIVLFDIPEKQRYGRDALRAKLYALGFFQFQKSAFILPYPCRDEIDVLVHAFALEPHVTFFETRELGYQEAKALAHFKIKKSNFLPAS